MTMVLGILLIGLAWLLGVCAVVAAPFLLAAAARTPKAPRPTPKPAPSPAPAPSPRYIRRWSNARRAWEINELERFQQLLDTGKPTPPPRDPFQALREKMSKL